jgi:coenzyme F420 hydrogenase subunit beta
MTNINQTLSHDLCTGCGVCEGACPFHAISTIVKAGRFLPIIDDTKCKNDGGCHRCMDACPGVGIDLMRISKELFTDNELKEDKMVGKYLKCFTGHSNNEYIRYHCASGGMISQFLVFLLEKKYIDGAFVTAFDPANELLISSYIATTTEDILKAKGSKYAPVSLHNAVAGIKAASGTKYVIVGLPCHIQGFRKLEAIDRKFRDKVLGYFAIYCSSGRTFYLTEHVFKERGIKKENLSYFAYRDEGCLGSMVAKQRCSVRDTDSNTEAILYKGYEVYKERYQSYYHPLRSFFIPRRCLFCIDHYGELGDVCFGDIHVEPYIQDTIGVNSLVVRKKLWLNWLLEAKKEGCITLDEISVEILNSSQKMSYKKKERNGRFINLNRLLGRVMPVYDVDYLHKPTIKTLIDYIQNRFQQFLGRHRAMWWLITLLKKNTSNLK